MIPHLDKIELVDSAVIYRLVITKAEKGLPTSNFQLPISDFPTSDFLIARDCRLSRIEKLANMEL